MARLSRALLLALATLSSAGCTRLDDTVALLVATGACHGTFCYGGDDGCAVSVAPDGTRCDLREDEGTDGIGSCQLGVCQ